jgi:hypothetical protein
VLLHSRLSALPTQIAGFVAQAFPHSFLAVVWRLLVMDRVGGFRVRVRVRVRVRA